MPGWRTAPVAVGVPGWSLSSRECHGWELPHGLGAPGGTASPGAAGCMWDLPSLKGGQAAVGPPRQLSAFTPSSPGPEGRAQTLGQRWGLRGSLGVG